MALQHLRTSTAHKRPIPSAMSAGQLAININEASPGLFFKDSNGDLVKVGPVHIGTDAPNSSPASVAATALVTGTVYQILTVGTSDFTLVGASANTVGTVFTATGTTTGTGTVSGQQGVQKGEQWLDTTGGTYVLKIYDGTAWRSESGTFVDVNGDTMTGPLILPSGTAAAPALGVGSTDNGLYSPGTDQVAISTNGTGRLFVSNNGTITTSQSIGVTGSLATWNAGLNLFSAGGGVGQIAASTDSSGTAGTLVFQTGTERMRIDSDGRLLVGTSTSVEVGIAVESTVQIAGGAILASATCYQNTNNGARVYLGKSRSTTPGSYSIVLNDDEVGAIGFAADDGTDLQTLAATIKAEVDGTPGANDMPGRLVFGTTADGASSPTERMRITSAGNVGVGVTSPSNLLHLRSDSASTVDHLYIQNRNGGANSGARIAFSNGTTDYADSRYAYIGAINTGASESGNHLVFATNANGASPTEKVRIDSSGNVEIKENSNTVSTGASLYLFDTAGAASSGNSSGRICFYSSDSTDGASIRSEISNTYENSSADSGLVFKTYNGTLSERLRIDSSGRLLVGTSSSFESAPGALLQIKPSSNVTPVISLMRNDTSITNGNNLGQIAFYSDDGTPVKTAHISAAASQDHTSAARGTDIVFSTTEASTADAPTERMRIKSDGIVNVGNTPVYADNAAAKTGGLVDGDVYRTSTGDLKIVYT